jgi:ribosome recycling factor
MSANDTINDAENRMKSAIEAMIQDFASYRTGRASPAILDRIHVEYYGTETPISQIANISIPEPRQLIIQPYEKNMTVVIERAIMKSDIGVNPVNDGSGIRLNFPAMTEDRRKDMVKQVHSRTEQGRIAIRNVRRDANDTIKGMEKKKEISEDDVRGHEARIQKITDTYIAKADDLGKKKEEELMQV